MWRRIPARPATAHTRRPRAEAVIDRPRRAGRGRSARLRSPRESATTPSIPRQDQRPPTRATRPRPQGALRPAGQWAHADRDDGPRPTTAVTSRFPPATPCWRFAAPSEGAGVDSMVRAYRTLLVSCLLEAEPRDFEPGSIVARGGIRLVSRSPACT